MFKEKRNFKTQDCMQDQQASEAIYVGHCVEAENNYRNSNYLRRSLHPWRSETVGYSKSSETL